MTTAPLSDDMIIDTVSKPLDTLPESDDEEDEPEPTKPPSHKETVELCHQLYRYLESHPNTDSYFPYVSALQDFAKATMFNTVKQSHMSDFLE